MSLDPQLSPAARNRELLDALLQRGSGTLEETPYPILLLAMALGERSGVLELRRNQLQKTIVFDSGSPVECRSNIATEMLGRYLVSLGKVSEQDCHAAFAVAASRGVPLGEILTERKLLAPSELYRALQQNLGRKLLEPFSWKDGTWSLSGDVPPVGSVLRVKVPQLLVTGILKVEPQESADQAAGRAFGRYLTLAPDPLFGLDHLRLSADQKKVIDAARRGEGIDALRDSAALDTDELHRIVFAFLLLGVLVVTDQPHPQLETVFESNPFATEPGQDASPQAVFVEPPPQAAEVTREQPSPPPAVEEPALVTIEAEAPAVDAIEAEAVMSAYLSYRRKDAFELLDLDEAAELPATIEAYLRMADRFIPSRFDAAAPDGLRDKAQEVFLAAARAWAELADPARRSALVEKREKSREHQAATTQAGQSAMIDPEALCQIGRKAVAAGKLREALSSFEMAAECDAQNGTYAAEAAWCRYQLRASVPATAIKLLKNAIRIDPKSGVAYLYAGQVLAAMGSKLEGQAYLGRAATLLPGDPRPAQALKAIQG